MVFKKERRKKRRRGGRALPLKFWVFQGLARDRGREDPRLHFLE